MEKGHRIQILDGLRVVAIFMVMIFHFYARYQGIYYRYSFNPPHVLMYGNMGVQLFFIISGFVITLTLTKSKNFLEFMKKRFLRLIPAMVICATITYLIFFFFDPYNFHPQSKDAGNLLFSYTFLSPGLISSLFHTEFRYIDGAYWSIWVELQFYILGGLTYFLSPKNFLRNYSIVSLIGLVAYVLFVVLNQSFGTGLVGKSMFHHIYSGLYIFPLFKNNLWFLAGIVVFKMYFEKKTPMRLAFLLLIFVIQLALLKDNYARGMGLGIIVVFLLFLYNQKVILFLSNKTLSKIGVASYSIYLIHQFIGFLIINRLSSFFGDFNWIIAIFLIAGFTAFGLLSYKYLERPFGKALKKVMFKPKKKKHNIEPELAVATLP